MRLSCLTLFLLAGAALAQTKTDPKKDAKVLPKEAKKAIDDANAEVKKARDRLLDTLQQIQDAETKKGNLDAALAVRAEIERLRKVDTTVAGGLTDDQTLADAKKLLVGGPWKLTIAGSLYTATYVFDADGTIVGTDAAGKHEGKWSVEERNKARVLHIVWGPNNTLTFPLTGNAKKLQGYKPSTRERVEIVRE